jgi:hypothetical protein
MNLRESIIENQAVEIAELKAAREIRSEADMRAEIAMTKVGVPSSFEDGNSSDSLGFHERIHILCDMLQRSKS